MTKVEEIFDNFLSKISDYSLLMGNLTDEEIYEDLSGYLKTARTKFYKCENSLKIVDDGFGGESFTVELHPFEIEILTSLMLVEYLKPQVLSSEVMKQSLSDKDFKIHSQASQLRELSLLYRVLRAEAGRMITEYTYIGLGEDKL